MAAGAAGPVFRLMGKKDLMTDEFTEVETGITESELAFRQQEGGHATDPNSPTFLAFADRYRHFGAAAVITDAFRPRTPWAPGSILGPPWLCPLLIARRSRTVGEVRLKAFHHRRPPLESHQDTPPESRSSSRSFLQATRQLLGHDA